MLSIIMEIPIPFDDKRVVFGAYLVFFPRLKKVSAN